MTITRTGLYLLLPPELPLELPLEKPLEPPGLLLETPELPRKLGPRGLVGNLVGVGGLLGGDRGRPTGEVVRTGAVLRTGEVARTGALLRTGEVVRAGDRGRRTGETLLVGVGGRRTGSDIFRGGLVGRLEGDVARLVGVTARLEMN